MQRAAVTLVKILSVFLLVFAAVGCDTIEGIFENEKEVKGIVEEVGADYLVVEAIRYVVTDKTEYENVSGLAEVSTGVEVEIDYEETGGERTALEVDVL